MADGDAGRCEPYRVEWRVSLLTRWTRIGTCETLGAAETLAAESLNAGGQARVLEQRVVLVRGLGQDDDGPYQAFLEFASRNLKTAERQAADTLAQADGLARALKARCVSDPDDRRDVEAAADAGEPMDGDFSDTAFALQPDATVTDMAGCVHRMGSGAVSLTACGECGADPGDDCAEPLGWRVEQARVAGLDVVKHPPAGANRARWHGWLDSLGVPRHAEPEQQTDTAPPVGAPTCDFRMGRRLTQSGQQARPLWKDVLCRECNAAAGEPCADPLEDRLAWLTRDGDDALAKTSAVAYWLMEAKTHGRAHVHAVLDRDHVPRHIAEHEADQAVDALIAKTGGESPLEYVTRGWATEVENLKADMTKPLGPDPWWRRLLQRTRR